jgi:hypothetical protein
VRTNGIDSQPAVRVSSYQSRVLSHIVSCCYQAMTSEDLVMLAFSCHVTLPSFYVQDVLSARSMFHYYIIFMWNVK